MLLDCARVRRARARSSEWAIYRARGQVSERGDLLTAGATHIGRLIYNSAQAFD